MIRTLLLVVTAALMSGCVGMADYLGPPPSAPNARPIDPEAVRVDPTKYPTFRVATQASPPAWRSEYNPSLRIKMVDILPTDEWAVRYRIGTLLIVVSETYDQRQCASL